MKKINSIFKDILNNRIYDEYGYDLTHKIKKKLLEQGYKIALTELDEMKINKTTKKKKLKS